MHYTELFPEVLERESVAMRWTREGEKLQAGICVFWDKRDGDHYAPFCEVQEVSGKMAVCFNSRYYG